MARSTALGEVTIIIAVITGVIFTGLFLGGVLSAANIFAGFIPLRLSAITQGGIVTDWPMLPVVLTPLSATLIHGGWLHVALNLLMLVYCGRQVETVIGKGRLVLLYAAGAYGAALAQWAWSPLDTTPMIGASGAISAIIGTYALLYSRQTVSALGPIPASVVRILWLAAAWIGLQLLLAFASGPGTNFGLIAIPAHIGGFLVGLLMTRPLLKSRFRGPRQAG